MDGALVALLSIVIRVAAAFRMRCHQYTHSIIVSSLFTSTCCQTNPFPSILPRSGWIGASSKMESCAVCDAPIDGSHRYERNSFNMCEVETD